jgi:uncharacterized membrane protein
MSKQSKNKINIDEKITAAMGSMKSIAFHTFLFIVFLTLPVYTTLSFDFALLILTTIVSLEAIYLALFIQISINRQAKVIEDVSDDIEEIQEDVEDIQEDVAEIEKDVEDISLDVDEIAEDVEDIQEEVDDEHPENVSEEQAEKQRKDDQKMRLEKLEAMLTQLISEIKEIKK